MATPNGWYAKALTGGGADALDAIDGDSLTDLDVAKVYASNVHYEYILDDDGAGSEVSPWRILPDTNPGTKVWLLQHSSVLVQWVNTQIGAVATGTTAIPWDDTIPQITEGDQYMTLAITPTSATNTLLIDIVACFANSAGEGTTVALFQDATAGALAAAGDYSGGANENRVINFTHKMTTGTTSATTFRIRIGGHGGGTISFNGYSAARKLGGVMASSITIREVR